MAAVRKCSVGYSLVEVTNGTVEVCGGRSCVYLRVCVCVCVCVCVHVCLVNKMVTIRNFDVRHKQNKTKQNRICT